MSVLNGVWQKTALVLAVLLMASSAYAQTSAPAGPAPAFPHPDGSNCASGEAARGTDEEGNAQDCFAISAVGGAIVVKEDDSEVDPLVTALDFLGADFDVSSSPAGEANVAITAAIARLLSPAFTGDPTAPTPVVTDNDTSLATTAFVSSALDRFHVVDYGALCDGSTVDTVAIQDTFDAADAATVPAHPSFFRQSTVVTFPAGNCLTVTITWKGQSIRGVGSGDSIITGRDSEDILFADPASFPSNSPTPFRIEGITFNVDDTTDASGSFDRHGVGNAAIAVEFDDGSGDKVGAWIECMFNDVRFRSTSLVGGGRNSSAGEYFQGIFKQSCKYTNVRYRSLEYSLYEDYPTLNVTSAEIFRDYNLYENLFVFACENGPRFVNNQSGSISGSQIGGFNKGLVVTGVTSQNRAASSEMLIGPWFAEQASGTTGINTIQIDGRDHVLLDITSISNVNDSKVTLNANGSTWVGGFFANANNASPLTVAGDENNISGLILATPTIPIVNTGDRNTIEIARYQGGQGSGGVQLLVNEATPSVLGHDKWRTGGTTTITDFDDGYEGKILTVVFDHSVILTDGTNILMCDSTNFAGVAGDVLSFIQKADTFWYEVGCYTTVGDSTNPPYLDGSSDGGTSFTLFEDVGESAVFDLHASIGVDATIMFGRRLGPEHATDWNVAFLNRDVKQSWSGEQNFANDLTSVKTIVADLYKAVGTNSVFIGEADDAGANDNPWVFVDSENGMQVTSDVGTMVLTGTSFDIMEISNVEQPASEHGAYFVRAGVPNFPGYVDELNVKHTLAYLFKPVIWLTETTTPTPVAATGAIWTTDDNELFFQDGAGATHLLHGNAFSEIWVNNPVHAGSPITVTIAAEDAFTKIDSFTVVGHEDDLGNVTGSNSTNDLTLSSIAGGEYNVSYHGSVTATGGSPKEMMFNVGITLATPKDITDVTDVGVSPIVITSTAHLLEDGDMVEIAGVLVNTAANGSYFVNNKTANTFEIVDLDGAATTGNGNYDEGTPTGDVTIEYPGDMIVYIVVNGSDLDPVAATGLHVLSAGDVLAVYVANLATGLLTDLTVAAFSFDAFRIGD